MDTKKLKEYLSHKTWLWRRIFGNFYLAHFGLRMQQIVDQTEGSDVKKILKLCSNEDDLKLFWNIAGLVDSQLENFTNAIEDLRFCRPISWQYDFVKAVSVCIGADLLQTLGLDSLTDAYCLAQLNDVDTPQLVADLDAKYQTIFSNAAHKTDLLRRNFSLLLEVMAPKIYNGNCANLNFREIVSRYIDHFGVKGLVEVLKKAQTAETELSADEKEVLALAYYSPYLSNNFASITPTIPGCSIAPCVAFLLNREKTFPSTLYKINSQLNNDDDDDDDGEIEKVANFKHFVAYFDPTERCLIEVQNTSPMYAHVYIEKFPHDYFNNSLPDFIQYKKGCLYTVEFVEDIKQVEAAQMLNQNLNALKYELIRLEKAWREDASLGFNKNFQHKYASTYKLFSSCFCIF